MNKPNHNIDTEAGRIGCPICHERDCDITPHERPAVDDEDCRGGAPRP